MANENGPSGELDVAFTPAASAPSGASFTSAGSTTGSTTPASTTDANGAGAGSDESRTTRQLVKDEAGKLTGQAGDRIRAFADDGKSRATGFLDELAKTIDDAAGTIDDKVGAQFGGYARNASGAVTNFADTLRNKDVDALLDDAREFVRKSPGVAIGAAAAVGFVLARLLRSGIDEGREG